MTVLMVLAVWMGTLAAYAALKVHRTKWAYPRPPYPRRSSYARAA